MGRESTDVKLRGVTMAISGRLRECVRKVAAVDEMILQVRVEDTCWFIYVVAVNRFLEHFEIRFILTGIKT